MGEISDTAVGDVGFWRIDNTDLGVLVLYVGRYRRYKENVIF